MRLLPRRLKARIVVTVACVLLLTGLAAGWMTARQQTDAALAAMRLNSSVIAQNFAESMTRPLLMEDYADIEAFLLRSVQLADIERLQVCEPDGAPIWDVMRQGAEPPAARAGIVRLKPPARPLPQVTTEGDRLVIWQPVVAGQLLGWLRAEFSLEAINQAQTRTWINMLLLVGLWVVVSALLIVLLLRPTMRSIGRLTQFSKQLDRHKGEQIEVPEQPLEIAELAVSLNEASARLATAEQQLIKLNQELERRVVERTAQLEAANKELEAFSYSVSHDLRAPLRHIDGFIHILREDIEATLGEDDRHYMEIISRAARQMETLIDDLLSFSRIGRSELRKGLVDLGALVAELIKELKPDTEDRHIDWRIAALPTVVGDRAMLRVVLSNLILNALKFTRQRDPAQIEIGCTASAAETVIFVRDNGAGFDMKYVDRLFGVFQRLHRAEDFEGTGIGLANVRRVVSRHGGRTWAEGGVDAGATFYFSLPAVAVSADTPADAATAA